MFMLVGLGAGGAATDFGRMELLRAEMQHAADAAALAGAVHLVGRTNARATSENVIRNIIANKSSIADGSSDIVVDTVTFYASYDPMIVAATDLETAVVEVTLQPKTIKLLFAPILSIFSPTAATVTLNARSVAMTRPYICNVPPMMLCDPSEIDPANDPGDPASAGRLIRLNAAPSTGNWSPGNFGLLSLPDGSTGTSAIANALAAVLPADCYQTQVITATGSRTVPVREGINTRFETSSRSELPAPNVINYPIDDDMVADPALTMGNGTWDVAGYWAAKHNGAGVPADLIDASRYQVYLYELGENFARNGKLTVYPVIDPASLPAGYTNITPAPDLAVAVTPAADSDGDGTLDEADPDYDGVPSDPSNVSSDGSFRRVMRVAVIQCIAEGVQGRGTYSTNGKFVNLFMTREVDGSTDPSVYAEVIRQITPLTDPEFHANVGLIE